MIGKAKEELFSIYQKSGDLSAAERASIISERIQRIDANTFSKDSLQILKDQERLELIYGSQILLNITNLDTIGTKKSKQELPKALLSPIIKKKVEVNMEKNGYHLREIYLLLFFLK